MACQNLIPPSTTDSNYRPLTIKQKPITLRDVARHSGYSPTTVSIVLNDAPLARHVAAATKLKIKDVAQRLGYRPNFYARSLRQQQQRTIGVLVFDISDPYSTPILRGIETSLYEQASLSVIADVRNDPARFERSLAMIIERRTEGLV